ncbi:hypothetical protein GCM10011274_03030 [Paraglaciecola chathamensis]|uniref:Uncharacterized protein n=1 Tax=Paraglaciecola chathamensis TaxID=368405 RepID=A0A8H9LYE4_9ALTE|nr:hypothetical protein GCM10011274_03030 [Paraglaciecola oceanifecundans]
MFTKFEDSFMYKLLRRYLKRSDTNQSTVICDVRKQGNFGYLYFLGGNYYTISRSYIVTNRATYG